MHLDLQQEARHGPRSLAPAGTRAAHSDHRRTRAGRTVRRHPSRQDRLRVVGYCRHHLHLRHHRLAQGRHALVRQYDGQRRFGLEGSAYLYTGSPRHHPPASPPRAPLVGLSRRSHHRRWRCSHCARYDRTRHPRHPQARQGRPYDWRTPSVDYPHPRHQGEGRSQGSHARYI